jgi:ankyrin repeat protein
MSNSHLRTFVGQVLAILVLLATTGFGPEPVVTSPISPDEFVHAMVADRTPVLDLYFGQRLDPNARGIQDRPLLLAATLQQDEPTVTRLLEAGASADLADETGFTPLMAAATQGNMNLIRKLVGGVTNINATDRTGRSAFEYAMASQRTDIVQLFLRLIPDFGAKAGDVVATALDTGNKEIIGMIFDRVPPLQQWTAKTRHALDAAIASDNMEQVKLLMRKQQRKAV